jgi:hypothetical protein
VNILAGISNGQITLLNVVKALGEYLMAEEDQLRAKGNALVLCCCTLFLHVKWQGLNFSLLSWVNVPLKRLIANLVRNILDVFDTLWTHGDNHWRSSGSCHILLWQA